VRILFVADIVGNPGRGAAINLVAALRSSRDIDFVIANAENAAGGLGITAPTASALLGAGIDALTLGNHAFAKREAWNLLADEPRLLRPLNYPPQAPGRGWGLFQTAQGEHLAVVNLMGRAFMHAIDCPFRAADSVLEEIGDRSRVVVVDVHAEATSEKVAMGHYLDGRVSAVIGTHTHVATSDECILPAGTAYLTDAGMTGVRDSVLGMDKNAVVERFITGIAGKFVLARGEASLQGVLLEVDSLSGRALSIERVSVS